MGRSSGSRCPPASRMDADRDATDFCAADTPEARAALADRQLATLAAREAVVRDFVSLDAEAARRRIATGPQGPVGGALIAVKDIIATVGFPTLYGSIAPENAGPRADAWCVAAAERLGGTILGKTVCTEFAFPLPGPTTNPHDARCSPGGSSSGSAAAVAAGFVSFALGTQTAGSTIRPASYCGVTGFKPSYGLLPTEGVQTISTTLDHLGVFARSPRDAWYFVNAMLTRGAETVAPRKPARLLALRLPAELPQGDGYPERLTALARALRAADVAVETRDLPYPLDDFRRLQQELCYWEAARLLLLPKKMRIVPQLEALLGPYLDRDASEYMAARRRRQIYRQQFEAMAADYDAVLLPAATGAAPPLAETGDAVMSRFWTALHVPAIAVPLWRTADGLPLGLQLLGALGTDRALAEVAQWFFERGERA
jgi:Asp-tRNA(Asn)/Glu-tRNA(Gln) amidotransferase A subunit family amidase